MAESKHTPGPWNVFWICSPAGTSARIFSDATNPSTDIAHIPKEWCGDGANARLIAGAPAMAEWLRVLTNFSYLGSSQQFQACEEAREFLRTLETP
jgi:hypothetical protein